MRHLSLFLGLNLCFALLAAQTGAAQNNPIVDVGVFNAPISNVSRAAAPKSAEPVFTKKIFWTEVGAYTVSNILDGFTTVARPQGYEEAGFPRGSSFLLGTQPSAARYVATMGRHAGSCFIRGIPAGTQPQAILETRRPHSDDSGDLCTHGWIR